MVFLTTVLWLRNPVIFCYFRIQEVLKHAQHFRRRKNRCYLMAIRAVTRTFMMCTGTRKLKKLNPRTLSAARPSHPGAPVLTHVQRVAPGCLLVEEAFRVFVETCNSVPVAFSEH
ncbi:39S ribosomal protein L20, mitochondrial-like [Octodon degus]|uniref:39S ribosomal protein L20, mitochondrial-like n=1 Tax=Octodon degus TaxID=10160 RepID=A0A6P6E6D3_OCTDE|nr:39S ribosomal protein L20, mitochondrial-like [Octodon degus]